MKLNLPDLHDHGAWTAKGYRLPQFDPAAVKARTLAQPLWIHFGIGNIFRAFPAVLQQRLLDAGWSDRGIIAAEAFDEEIIDRAVTPFDGLSLAVTLNPDGSVGKEIVASVVHAVKASTGLAELTRFFQSPSLQMVSLTITEKGYAVKNSAGEYFPWIAADLGALPDQPASLISLLTLLVYRRYQAGRLPVALVSMDNCAHNGSKLSEAVLTFAGKWAGQGLVEAGFVDYLKDPGSISFTWSMIDKITPRPTATAQAILAADGFADTGLIVTARNTYTAAFVNTEPTQYLVIEDWFPNGRPPLEKAGVLFADRATVDRIETMKVTTCLNPLHTVLAIFGCLLNFRTIADAVNDPQLRAFVEKVGYAEGMPVVVDPGIIKPQDFIRTVLQERFPNPFLPDMPQRIATDTSQKIPVRFGETLKAYIRRGRGEEQRLTFIPLFFAGWLRYLLGVDDAGNPMVLSPDPMLQELQANLAAVRLGGQGPFGEILRPILANARIFGVDLAQLGLAEKVTAYFSELAAGPGAVRATLGKYLGI